MTDGSEGVLDVPCSDPMLLCCACERLLDKPQRLSCLHSFCLSCLRPSSADGESDLMTATTTATCPICQEVSSEVTCNGFLESRVSRHIDIAKSSLCSVCADRGDAHQQAEAWCTSCRMSFCDACLPYHDRCHKAHGTFRIDDVRSWDEAFPAPSPHCSSHAKPFDFVCFSCKTCRCSDCWPSCAKLQHNLEHMQAEAVATCVEKAKRDVANLAQMLLIKAEVLSKQRPLEEAVKSDFQKDLKKLKDTKQQLIAVIDDVCHTVEQLLKDTYDGLRETAAAISRSSETLERKVDRAAKYSRYVVDVGLPSELLTQEQSLLSRMKSLCDELDLLGQPLDAGQYVACDSPLPADIEQLKNLVTSWIGLPRAITDDLRVRKAQPDMKFASSTIGILDFQLRLGSWVSTDVNIGVIGASGVGKSSLINTLRRLRVDDPDAAQADVTQTTIVPTPYTHPKYPRVKLWDVPGVGTTSFPRGSYLEHIEFHKYDYFLITCCLRFTEDDLWFARAVHQATKRFCFVRTKVDDDVRHDREDHPTTHNEVEVLRRIRDYCASELSKAGFMDPPVFLVCKNPELFDFPAFEEKLVTNLLDLRRIGT